MFSHIVVGSNDIERSRAFYDALFAAMEGKPGFLASVNGYSRLVYAHNGGRFLVTAPIDGEPACHANGGTIGFRMASTAMADAWQAAGITAGGTAIEDPPGWRERPGLRMYLAYLRDPDGNKLCALYTE